MRKPPVVHLKGFSDPRCAEWDNNCRRLNRKIHSADTEETIVAVDYYQGVYHEDIQPELLQHIKDAYFIHSEGSQCARTKANVKRVLEIPRIQQMKPTILLYHQVD